MEKRTIVALALSFLVLGFYPVLLQKMYPEYYKNKAAMKAGSPAAARKNASPSSLPAADVLPMEGADKTLANGRVELALSPSGGVLHRVTFPGFHTGESQDPLELF